MIMKKQVLLFSLLLFPFMGHAFKQVIDGIKYDLGGDKAKVVWYAEYEGDIIIPPTVEYGNITYTVNCIDRAFSSCDKVTSVTLPNTIVSITQYSLSGTSITSITIPESVTNLEGYVFQGCHSLETVVLPSTLGTIKKYTFASCTALKEIEIPKTVTTIEELAFEGCSSLTSVVIPESVTTIGQLAFYESGLVSVAIMGKTTLGSSAFRSSVLDVYCFADTVLKAEHGTFTRDFIKMQSTLHVPAALVDAYKETDPWNYFKYVVPLKDGDPQSTGIDELHSQENSTKKTCYNLAGQKVNNPTKGLFVVEGKKIVVK
jgi:hypothetical protein